ncbi:MauE/DoxX family redox-associated membrane protein [Candidatus Nitronereus thalassa]|uniref:Methylamine utilisation protein MauE domain-containing protein n=1 Tax=Candidatus Nitronereus thalassa TaxID=3020898 RepID=A0ABU3KBW1_9BACT|nr:MauE/DoxX family redox-associated membrane protein [Candidatus Nitronereus thalassa]MDT7043719.1 hypothetical protein [Candidatus Nitronereus thalassa]
MSDNPSHKKREKNRGGELKDYWSLFSLILITAAAGTAITWNVQGGWLQWMHYFMGFFLCCFAMLKIFNLSAFADGFQMYDLIAKHSRAYAYIYPFIELGLGLSFLSFLAPAVTYSVTIIVMIIGTLGVVSALRKDLDINCPCMGSVLDVPLSTVTLTEDVGMGVMAVVMLTLTPGIM